VLLLPSFEAAVAVAVVVVAVAAVAAVVTVVAPNVLSAVVEAVFVGWTDADIFVGTSGAPVTGTAAAADGGGGGGGWVVETGIFIDNEIARGGANPGGYFWLFVFPPLLASLLAILPLAILALLVA